MHHESWGRMLLPWAIALFVVAALPWAWFRCPRGLGLSVATAA
ncbi:hypothetical protein [Microbacterium sp. A84]